METNQIHDEVREMLGLVPQWMSEIPKQALEGYWGTFRDFYFAETAIPNKYKELIGLAVAGATRCRYCALFHTQAAKLHGATDEEIAEASLMSGFTMMASSFLNAQQADYDQFRDETMQIVSFLREQHGEQPEAREQPTQH